MLIQADLSVVIIPTKNQYYKVITFPTPLDEIRNRALNFHIGFKSKSKQTTGTHLNPSTLLNDILGILS